MFTWYVYLDDVYTWAGSVVERMAQETRTRTTTLTSIPPTWEVAQFQGLGSETKTMDQGQHSILTSQVDIWSKNVAPAASRKWVSDSDADQAKKASITD